MCLPWVIRRNMCILFINLFIFVDLGWRCGGLLVLVLCLVGSGFELAFLLKVHMGSSLLSLVSKENLRANNIHINGASLNVSLVGIGYVRLIWFSWMFGNAQKLSQYFPTSEGFVWLRTSVLLIWEAQHFFTSVPHIYLLFSLQLVNAAVLGKVQELYPSLWQDYVTVMIGLG